MLLKLYRPSQYQHFSISINDNVFMMEKGFPAVLFSLLNHQSFSWHNRRVFVEALLLLSLQHHNGKKYWCYQVCWIHGYNRPVIEFYSSFALCKTWFAFLHSLLLNTQKENLFPVVEKVIFSGNVIFHNRRLTQKYHYSGIFYFWPQYVNIRLIVEAKI